MYLTYMYIRKTFAFLFKPTMISTNICNVQKCSRELLSLENEKVTSISLPTSNLVTDIFPRHFVIS